MQAFARRAALAPARVAAQSVRAPVQRQARGFAGHGHDVSDVRFYATLALRG